MNPSWMVPQEARLALRQAAAKYMVESLGLERKLLHNWHNTWSPRHLDPPLIEAAVIAMLTSMDMDVGGDFERYLVAIVARYCREPAVRINLECVIDDCERAERSAWRKAAGLED